jgi:adenosine/AMP kinase
MVKISKELIDSLSKLAKINLTKEQKKKYAGEFSSVMGYMEEIKNLDVNNIPETDQGRGIIGVVDGGSPVGVENEKEIKDRKDFLRKIGYKS